MPGLVFCVVSLLGANLMDILPHLSFGVNPAGAGQFPWLGYERQMESIDGVLLSGAEWEVTLEQPRSGRSDNFQASICCERDVPHGCLRPGKAG